MKSIKKCLLLSGFVALVGCAQVAETVAKKNPIANAEISVPALSVAVDCKDCDVSAEVAARIVERYNAIAKEKSTPVSTSAATDFRITRYYDRGKLRLVVAAVAGPLGMLLHVDRIEGAIAFEGQTIVIQRTARVPLFSITDVADDAANEIFDKLRAASIKRSARN